MKKLSWQEFKALALAHYNNGGDGVVECWSESDYDEFGHVTKAEALEMFGSREEVILDMTADAESYREEAQQETEEDVESIEYDWFDDDWFDGFGKPGEDWRAGDAPWNAPGMSISDFIR